MPNPNPDASTRRWRGLYRVTAFLLSGLATGATWFAALLPVGVTGGLGYDLSRYCFALGVVVALVGLRFRPWRAYGLSVFFVGLVLAIACWGMSVPIPVRPPGQLFVSLVLFGGPLAITSFFAIGFSSLTLASKRKHRLEDSARTAIGAPRRFGMGTLMIVVLAVSALFASANWLALPPPVSIFAGGFLALIGGMQMLMNKVPRAASVGTGAVLLPLTIAATWATISGNMNPAVAPMVDTAPEVCFVGAHFVAIGAVCGYVGGVLVAGLFLVIERVGHALRSGQAVTPTTP